MHVNESHQSKDLNSELWKLMFTALSYIWYPQFGKGKWLWSIASKSYIYQLSRTQIRSVLSFWSCIGTILRPNPDSLIILESCRGNHILFWVTGNRDDSISMAFKFLNHSFLLKIPQVYTVILRAANNVFPICHRKCGCYAIHFVHMTCIDLQEFPRWVVAQFLKPKNEIYKSINPQSYGSHTYNFFLFYYFGSGAS